MKTRLIVEIDHPKSWEPVHVQNYIQTLLSSCVFDGTVTLADSLPVRDTMPEAREAAMQQVQAIGQEIEP